MLRKGLTQAAEYPSNTRMSTAQTACAEPACDSNSSPVSHNARSVGAAGSCVRDGFLTEAAFSTAPKRAARDTETAERLAQALWMANELHRIEDPTTVKSSTLLDGCTVTRSKRLLELRKLLTR